MSAVPPVKARGIWRKTRWWCLRFFGCWSHVVYTATFAFAPLFEVCGVSMPSKGHKPMRTYWGPCSFVEWLGCGIIGHTCRCALFFTWVKQGALSFSFLGDLCAPPERYQRELI